MYLRLSVLFLCALLLTGCSNYRTLPDWFAGPDPAVLERALSGESLLGQAQESPAVPDPSAILHLTEEMKSFAEFYTQGIRDPYDRAEALYQALVYSWGRGITYDLNDTYTAAEVFAIRRANCLGFTLLYVAMGRHVGLDVRPNEVEMPPVWNISDDQVLMRLMHVNAMVMLPRGERAVMDLEMARYRVSYPQTLISDRELAAQYHNNRAMELAAIGDFAEAHRHVRKALLLDGRRAYIWSNLGSMHARQGLLAEAEAAWLKGYSLERNHLTVISNLSNYYRWLGDEERAAYYGRRARQYQQSNPYYLYAQASRKYDSGDYATAEELIRRALRRKNDEPRFYRLAAEIYGELGQARQAEAMLRRGETI